jgi:hypothetical protein
MSPFLFAALFLRHLDGGGNGDCTTEKRRLTENERRNALSVLPADDHNLALARRARLRAFVTRFTEEHPADAKTVHVVFVSLRSQLRSFVRGWFLNQSIGTAKAAG